MGPTAPNPSERKLISHIREVLDNTPTDLAAFGPRVSDLIADNLTDEQIASWLVEDFGTEAFPMLVRLYKFVIFHKVLEIAKTMKEEQTASPPEDSPRRDQGRRSSW